MILFTASALERAAFSEIIPNAGAVMHDALNAILGDRMDPDAMVSMSEAGLAVGATLLGRDAANAVEVIGGQFLNYVGVNGAGERISLTPVQAREQGLLAGWACDTFADAVGRVIGLGAAGVGASWDAPTPTGVAVEFTDNGAVGCWVQLLFSTSSGPVDVGLSFGSPQQKAILRNTRTLDGKTLLRLGDTAMRLTEAQFSGPSPFSRPARPDSIATH